MLEIEPGAKVVESTCNHCGQPMTRVTGFVYRDGDAHAVFYASCYHHDGEHEVWIDAVFSPTWDEDADDRFTFGCRVGPIDGQDEPAASLVAAAAAWDESPPFGHKLSRDEALVHPRLCEFWELVDHLLIHNVVVSTHMYGSGAGLDMIGDRKALPDA